MKISDKGMITTMKSYSESYREAGVDVTAGYRAVELMKKSVAKTYTDGVVSDIGGFGGLFMPNFAGMDNPVLVSGTDGVGTKLCLAFLMDKHDTIGIDCVAMSVNDVICSGAQPMFFLDYIACGKNIPEKIASIVSGVSQGCVQAGCALIGGETAEHPGMMPEDEYDIAGFCVGIVDEADILNSESMKEGDVLIGISSSGVHSNGFSLIRRVLNIDAKSIAVYSDELSSTLGEALLTPTRIYRDAVFAVIGAAKVRCASHITGGGFQENLPRMMKKGLAARINKSAIPKNPIFELIRKAGNIPELDMYNTFNMGMGMCLAVSSDTADAAIEAIKNSGERAFVVGEVVKSDEGVILC